MREARMVGKAIKKLTEKKGIGPEQLSQLLSLPVEIINMGLAGRQLFSFDQLEQISNYCDISMDLILDVDSPGCSAYAIDCMNDFTNINNCEDVLDLIYDYLDILDCVNNS